MDNSAKFLLVVAALAVAFFVKRRRFNAVPRLLSNRSGDGESSRKRVFEAFYRLIARENFWLISFTAVLAVATVALVIVAYIQTKILASTDAALNRAADAAIDSARTADRLREITATTERAWVGPVNGEIEGAIELDKPLKIAVSFANTGRQPAILNTFVQMRVSDKSDWDNGFSLADIYAWTSSCVARTFTETDPNSAIRVAYPAATGTAYVLHTASNEVKNGKSNFLITDRIISGDDVAVLNGCFVYKSFGADRRSTFCFYYINGTTDKARLSYCPVGQDAD